jgi:ABC-type phosphate transport system substrate-binding protein
MRKTGYILAFVVMLACSLGNSQASQGGKVGDIAVVVNASNPVNDLSLSELRNMLTGDRRFWKGNVRIKLILREPGTRERDAVLGLLLEVDNKAFAAQWRARVFRGEATDKPLSVRSASQVEQYLLENPGGITFMTAKTTVPQLKVLRLEGKRPGEHGYALK